MPLPTAPSTWDITAAGRVGVLVVSTGNTGPLSGTIFGNPFVGFFDETSQTLSIYQSPGVSNTSGFNNVLVAPLTIFQGLLFHFTQDSINYSVLTGTSSANSGTNSPPSYSMWFAQNPSPVKTGKGQRGQGS
jgi:hypothetical protein